jgi:hypothetical protein
MLLSGAEFRLRVLKQVALALALGAAVGCLHGFGVLDDTGTTARRIVEEVLAIAIVVLSVPGEYVIPRLRYAQACLLFKVRLPSWSQLHGRPQSRT